MCTVYCSVAVSGGNGGVFPGWCLTKGVCLLGKMSACPRGCLSGGVDWGCLPRGVCLGLSAQGVSVWGVCARHPIPPCEQNDRQVLKQYLAATTLRTVKMPTLPTSWFTGKLYCEISIVLALMFGRNIYMVFLLKSEECVSEFLSTSVNLDHRQHPFSCEGVINHFKLLLKLSERRIPQPCP